MADPRSMTGSKYEATTPSGFTPNTRKISSLIYDNPNMRPATRREGAPYGYLAEGLPVDYEGLATAYALKYGQRATEKLLEALPYMNQRDLVGVIQDVRATSNESQDMDRRERQTYERAGMNYIAGKYQRGE